MNHPIAIFDAGTIPRQECRTVEIDDVAQLASTNDGAIDRLVPIMLPTITSIPVFAPAARSPAPRSTRRIYRA